ncbi:MAG: hypothetical protein ACK5HO_05960 [Pseudomonadota bacterium]|jgi:hypothetical protein
MTNKINSALIELHFLISAPPTDVLRYLDNLANDINDRKHPLTDAAVEALLSRNDKVIDIGLAIIAHKQSGYHNDDPVDYLAVIVERYPNDPDVLTACLSNRVSIGYFDAAPWLQQRLDDIIHNGTKEQLAALFSNEILPSEILEAALNHENTSSDISDDRYTTILWHLLKNPQIRREPKDDFDYDWTQHRIIQSTWGLLLKLEATRANAELLSEYIQSFQELETPRLPKDRSESASVNGSNKWLDDYKAFLEIVFKRWATPASWEHKDYDPWGRIRRTTIEKLGDVRSTQLEEFILTSNDRYRVIGFFSSLEHYNYEQLMSRFDYFLSTYGGAFLEGLISNDRTFLRSNKHIRQIARAAVAHQHEDLSAPYYRGLGWKFHRRVEQLSNGPDSHLYISSDYDFETDDDPSQTEESANLADEVKRMKEKVLDRDRTSFDQHVSSLFDLMSALADKVDIVVARMKEGETSSLNHTANLTKAEPIKKGSMSKWGYILLGLAMGYLLRK